MYRITLEIEKLAEGPFLGTSPELPGLIVQADTVEDVVSMAPAIAHDLIAVMLETNQALPAKIEFSAPTVRLPVLVPA